MIRIHRSQTFGQVSYWAKIEKVGLDAVFRIGRTSGEARAWLRGYQAAKNEVIDVTWRRHLALGDREWIREEEIQVTKEGFRNKGSDTIRSVLPWA